MKFKLTTANILFDSLDAPWDTRRYIMAQTLNKFAPDLLGTQEGRIKQLKDLASLLPDLRMVDQHRTWLKERMYPCIFINPKKIRVIESGDSWLSETPDIKGSISFGSAYPRLCTWIVGEFIEQNLKFFFVNTHLDHENEDTRVMQTKILIQEVLKHNTKNYPIIITGDFNSDPFNMTRKTLTFFLPTIYDPWSEKEFKEEQSFHKFGKNSDGHRIDWIMVDKSIHCSNLFMNKTMINSYYPSDHYPVMGEFEIK